MALKFNCKHCNEIIISKFLKTGELAECKNCGEKNTVPKNFESVPDSQYESSQPNKKTIEVSVDKSSDTNEVIIKDIKMSFGSMVEFMVKWAIASIPAFIILFLIGMMVMGVFGVGIATLFK